MSHYLLGLPLAVGFVLGAVVSPPDAVAPMAIARRFAMPSRILTILEGEGLVNDATALILFSFAVARGDRWARAFSLPAAVGEFLPIVAGEIVWGLAIGWGALALRRWASEPRVEMVFALLTPFAAFWVPESLGGSGVLATVVCGLYVSWNGPRFISPATRLQGFFVWDLVVYLIEGVIFLLTGLQARVVADTLDLAQWERLALACAAVCAVIIAGALRLGVRRHLSAAAAVAGRCARRDPAPPWQRHLRHRLHRHPGRGVAGGGAVHSPDGGRRALSRSRPAAAGHLRGDPGDAGGPGLHLALGDPGCWALPSDGQREADAAKRREIAARLASIDAALARLDPLEGAVAAPETVAALRRRHDDRRAYFVAACQDLVTRRCQQCQRGAAAAVPGRRARQHRRSLCPGRDQRRSPPPHRARTGSGRFPHPP